MPLRMSSTIFAYKGTECVLINIVKFFQNEGSIYVQAMI